MREIQFTVSMTLEDTDKEKTEPVTETDMQDWMDNAPMAWSSKGINCTDVVVSIDYDSDDELEDEV